MTERELVAGYQLQARIGVGGMAEIFLARREGPGGFSKQVAIKRVLPALARDAGLVAMFLDEARLAAQLSCANLVQVFDFGEERGTYYMVMEYVDGADLATLLAATGALEVELVLHIGRELCTALDYLHHAEDDGGQPLGIVHRDITPANVLISRGGDVKLGDFGIAKTRARALRTGQGTIKGTLCYLSPEQARGDEVDPRTDVYGLGLLLFELLTGERFLQAEGEAELLRCAEAPAWRSPRALRPQLPRGVEDVLQRALAVEPERRFAEASELGAALAQWCPDAARPQAQQRLRALIPGADQPTSAPQLHVADADAAKSPLATRSLAERNAEPARGPHTEVLAPAAGRRPLISLGVAAVLGLVALVVIGGVLALMRPGEIDASGEIPVDGGVLLALGQTPVNPTAADAAAQHLMADSGAVDVVRPTSDGAGFAMGRAVAPGPGSRPRNRRGPRDAGAVAREKRVDAASPATVARAAENRVDAAVEIERARAAFEAIAQTMRARGLLAADVPALERRRRELARAIEVGELSPAAVERLHAEVRAFAIDRAFVDAKLQRLNNVMAERDLDERQREAIRRRTRVALSHVVSGRFEAANQELNGIVQLLGE